MCLVMLGRIAMGRSTIELKVFDRDFDKLFIQSSFVDLL